MSIFESLQKKRPDGYPKVKETIVKRKFKTNSNEPDYDRPLVYLEKVY
ncbi:hypothetical protein [Flavobacterium phage FL-1]|nr:hypothetical protein [Flavobacterium phage FL-1]